MDAQPLRNHAGRVQNSVLRPQAVQFPGRLNDVVAAYEIEQVHTYVSTSLLRLYDLGTLLPTRQVHLCIVTPGGRFEKIRFELSGPSFRDQGPRKNCVLISEELLLQQETHILRWASSPAVIEELICHTGGGEQ